MQSKESLHYQIHKKNITISQRDETFEACIKLAKERYELKTLEYSKDERYWKIECALFVGSSRIGESNWTGGEAGDY
jgi:hypothetical protein